MKLNLKKNDIGFSLIEVMIGAGLLAMAAITVMKSVDYFTDAKRDVEDTVLESEVLLAIQNIIIEDMRYVPPLPVSVFNEKQEIKNNTIKNFFKVGLINSSLAINPDLNKSDPKALETTTHRCYSKSLEIIIEDGVLTGPKTQVECYIHVWFFHAAALDYTVDVTDLPEVDPDDAAAVAAREAAVTAAEADIGINPLEKLPVSRIYVKFYVGRDLTRVNGEGVEENIMTDGNAVFTTRLITHYSSF